MQTESVDNLTVTRTRKRILLIPGFWLSLVFFGAVLFLLPAYGEDNPPEKLIFRVNSSVLVEREAISKTILSLNGPVDVRGRVDGNIIAVGKPVYIQGVVENSVIVLGHDIILTEGSAIWGDAMAIGGEVLQSYGSLINGKIREMHPSFHWDLPGLWERFPFQENFPFFHFDFTLPEFILVFRLIFLVVITALTVVLLPKKIRDVSELIRLHPWKSFSMGLLVIICLLPVTVLLGMTVMGVLMIPVILLCIVLAGFIGGIGVKYFLGYHLLSALNIERVAMLWSVLSGLFMVEMLRLFPIVAVIILPFLFLLGLGGFMGTFTGGKAKSLD